MKTITLLIAFASFAGAQNVDRSRAPKLGELPSVHVPSPTSFTLSNGVTVVHIEKTDVPLLQLTLLVPGGNVEEKSDKLGLAGLTASMMTEGAGKRSALELAEEIDFLGISLSAFAGNHRMGISLFTPTARFDQALALMSDVLLRPTFPEEELNRKKKQLLVSLIQAHDNPVTLAQVAVMESLFGKEHPYGRTSTGNEASIRSFTREDLVRFHKTYFVSEQAVVVSCGAISPGALKEKLESAWSGWSGKAAAGTAVSNAAQVKGRRILLIDKPGAAQTVIRVGRIGVERLTPDYYRLVVLNTIFGGSFTSRLNSNLREKNGYSYGAWSTYGFRPAKGPFLIGTSVQTDVTDKALTEIFNEIDALKKLTQTEIDKAKNYEALSYPSNFASVQSLAGMLTEKVIYGLPDTYFNDYTQNILRVDLSGLRKAVSTTIDASNVVIVLVGDRSIIEGPVKALSLGPITHLTHEDVLGKIPVVD
jgi:predicted Zn-dependent peptidase